MILNCIRAWRRPIDGVRMQTFRVYEYRKRSAHIIHIFDSKCERCGELNVLYIHNTHCKRLDSKSNGQKQQQQHHNRNIYIYLYMKFRQLDLKCLQNDVNRFILNNCGMLKQNKYATAAVTNFLITINLFCLNSDFSSNFFFHFSFYFVRKRAILCIDIVSTQRPGSLMLYSIFKYVV